MEQNEILENEQLDETQKYIDAIQEMKKTSVSRDEYDRIRDENKKLLESLVNGKSIENASAEATKPDIKELRDKFMHSSNMSNLEYWKTTLELRDAIIEQTGADPFLPYGQKIAPTADDVQKANNVASVVKECIEYADGDSAIFTNELQRRTVDTAPARPRR